MNTPLVATFSKNTSRTYLNHTAELDWVPLAAGTSFKPISFFPGDTGYQLLLRVEPGTVVQRHHHTGEIHAFVLSGQRIIGDSTTIIGPGSYVYEPVDNIDSWRAIGDEPCIIHIEVNGRIEYLDDNGAVTHHTDASTARAAYLAWCVGQGVEPRPDLASGAGSLIDTPTR